MHSASILIIDDEPIIYISFAKWITLQAIPWSVETASSGKEGLTRLREKHFDITILDYQMPQMNGLEVLEQIAQAGFETNVMMLTGFATQHIASQAAQLGATALLSKPMLNSELVAKIQEVLKNQDSDRICDRLKLFSAKPQKIQTYTG